MAQLIFPHLVTLDDRQLPVVWAAASHQISADGLVYTFHLHKGMTWSDGTAIDATTFAYSINRSLDPCTASSVAYYLYDLAGAEAFNNSACPFGAIKSTATLIGSSIQTSDPLTLRLTLAHPAGYFLARLTWPTSYAVPQALVERYTTPVRSSYDGSNGTTATWTEHLTDNGPFGGSLFLLTTWKHARTTLDGIGRMTFDRNERFWGKKPALRRIEYTMYPNASIAWPDFISGVGDSAFPDNAAAMATARTLHGVIVQQVPGLALRFLTINWNTEPFNDVRVRQALTLALDRQAIAHELCLDACEPTIHLVPEGMPGYNPDLTDAAGRRGKDALTPDLDAARALLKGYAAEKCRGAWTRCAPLYIYLRFGGIADRLLHLLVNQWSAAFPGWQISGDTGEADMAYEVLQRCAECFATYLDGAGADYSDPQEVLSLHWMTHGAANISHASVRQVDTLLAQADGMTDLATRVALYQQAEQLLVDQGATVPLTQPVMWYAVRARVVGWQVAPTGVTPLSVWQTAYLTRSRSRRRTRRRRRHNAGSGERDEYVLVCKA
jgi:oligopeptide transport system substrate-binding protein